MKNFSFINFLPPWVETNIQPAFYDKESGSVLQQTARMYAKVNQLVRHFNCLAKETKETVDEYITKFVELKDFVDTYFENLDVQEEINNKLDAMVEDGTLQEIIGEYIFNGSGSVQYIFPNTTNYTSEYNLIKGYNKSILIDCGLTQEYTNLTDTLTKYEVEHIDYMIITHFHVDHCGNLIQLYSDGICDKTTVLILPTFDTEQWAENSAYAQYQAIMAYITSNDIPYINPSEGYSVEINSKFGFKIYNTDDMYYVDHNINSDYNNTSLITLINHFGQNSLYVGDCYKHSLKKIYDDGVIPDTIALYKAGHHGIDNNNISIIEFIRNLNIENVVYVTGMSDIAQGKTARGGTGGDLNTVTDNIFITAYNKVNVEFNSYVNSFDLVSGFNQSGLDNLDWCDETIYVDADTQEDLQNGTQAYPFKNLTQAIGYLNRNNGRSYTINIADGTYSTVSSYSDAKPSMYGCTNTIKIVGNGSGTILNYGFNIRNCSNVSISNLKIENKMNSRIFNISNSHVTIDNVTVDKHTDYSEQYAFYITDGSYVKITNTSILNSVFGVYEIDSIVDLDTITFTEISQQCLYGRNGIFRRSDNLTITDSSVSHGRYSVGEKPYFEKGLLLWSGTHVYSDGSITTLFARPARLTKIDVEFTIGTNNYTKSFDVIGSGNSTYEICETSTSTSNIIIDNTKFLLGDGYIAQFTASRHTTEAISDGTITQVTDADNITVTKIIGH